MHPLIQLLLSLGGSSILPLLQRKGASKLTNPLLQRLVGSGPSQVAGSAIGGAAPFVLPELTGGEELSAQAPSRPDVDSNSAQLGQLQARLQNPRDPLFQRVLEQQIRTNGVDSLFERLGVNQGGLV